MSNNVKKLIMLVVLIVLPLTACTPSEPVGSSYSYDGSLKITGIDNTFEVLFNDIFKMEAVTQTVKSVSSSGEQSTTEVKGVLLDTVLNIKGLNQKDYNSIRFIASDGYEIDVPAEVVNSKDIILAYEFDGEPLPDNKQPLRIAIDDVRSMYFVSQLQEVQLNLDNKEESTSTQKVIVLETEASNTELHDYTYYESNDKAIKVSYLFEKYNVSNDCSINFVASDGFEKTETYEVLENGYIKVTGDNIPLFIAPSLPKGMHVKNILSASCDNVTFMSASQAIASLPSREIDEISGVKLEEFVNASGLKSSSYIFTASDDYQVEVSNENLAHGIIYVKDNVYRVKFDETMPKSASVKYILSIEANGSESNGSSTIAFENGLTSSWIINFTGLSDGSFDFTSEKAARKLDLVSLETTYTKNDKQITDTWKGYRVLDVLSFLKVTDFSKLVITSVDGFNQEYSKDEIDEKTILAVVKNDVEMTDEDNLVRIVQDTQFATKWIKGVCKIEIK